MENKKTHGWRKFIAWTVTLVCYMVVALQFKNPDTAPYFELAMAFVMLYLGYGATNSVVHFIQVWGKIKTKEKDDEGTD